VTWVEQKKQQFIRWYYGYFVYDPKAETFTFGLHRSYGATRLSMVIDRLRRWF
jgi:hypothetical protein